MKIAVCLAVIGAAGLLAACSSSHPAAKVPSLAGSGSASGSAAGGQGAGRVAALRAAAQCIRDHGVPRYQDPVLTADGHVYTDARSIEELGGVSTSRAQAGAVPKSGAPAGSGSRSGSAGGSSGSGDRGGGSTVLDAIRAACGTLLTAAGFQPDDEAPAPPALVQAGVRAARCLRANGLPSYRDPTSATPFTPGHGFSISGNELPNSGALGKQDPAVQRAFTACRSLLDAAIRESDLQHLGGH